MMTLARDAERCGARRWPLVWGGALVTVGVMSLGDRMGWWPGLNWAHLAPILLIVVGALLLLPPWNKAAGVGFWLVVEGALFLLSSYGIAPINRTWPLFIVAAGVWIMVAGGRSRRDARRAR
jgi:hypothetical protein